MDENFLIPYPLGERGETYSGRSIHKGGDIPCTTSYGCKYRVGFALKMPPWTGCDDLTGKFVINKCKLKIGIYYEKEKQAT